MPLSPKQGCFCLEYLKDMNATQAAIRAGYSKRSAATISHENLRKPEIAARVAELIEQRNERVQVDSDWILRRLIQLDQADIADAFDAGGALKPLPDMPKAVARLLSRVVVVDEPAGSDSVRGSTTRWQIRLIDRLRVLELIGKHVAVSAWAVPAQLKAEVTSGESLVDRVAAARARLARAREEREAAGLVRADGR